MGIYWAPSNRPGVSTMAETLLLTDVGAGDTTTGQHATGSAEMGGGMLCHSVVATAVLTAENLLSNINSLTGWSARGSLVVALSSVGAACTESPDDPSPTEGGSASLVLEAWIAGEWVQVDTLSLTAPDLASLLTQTANFNVSRSLSPSISSCDVRLIALFAYAKTGNSTTLSTTINLTDWRLTGTDTGTPCPDSSVSGGEGGSGGGSGSDACGCGSWTPKPSVATTWIPKRCS